MKAVNSVDIVDGKCVVTYSDGSEQELYEYPPDENATGVTSVNGMTGNVVIPTATTSANGLMSKTDKSNLDTVRTQVADLKNNLITDIQDNVNWVVGGIDGNSGELRVTENQYLNRLVTPEFLPLSDIAVGTGGQLSPFIYDKDGARLGNLGSWVTSATISDILNRYPTASKMRVIFRRANNSSVDISDIGTYGVKIYANSSDINTQSSFGKTGIFIFDSFENGSLNNQGLNNNESAYFSKRVRSTGFIPCKAGYRYSLETVGRTDILTSVSFYSSYNFNINRVSNTPFQSAISFIPSSDGYFRILYRPTGSGDLSASEIKYVIIKANTYDINYMVSSDFMKRNLDVNYLGALSSNQSFCVYGGYYYSTDGDNIYKQNGSFSLVDSNTIDLGHGNSLQLGSNGLAYASGWDDNKIYVVDLETLSVTDTITLPTTGYTTSAVDDINGIAYIFQRDTEPSTPTKYNFIVYDYINDEIKMQKQTSISFGGMQSCDFYNNRIIVLYGLGTNAVPNGYKVFDTNGNILSEYFLSTFASVEPEGVCLDRSTKDLLVSFVNNNLYKITMK